MESKGIHTKTLTRKEKNEASAHAAPLRAPQLDCPPLSRGSRAGPPLPCADGRPAQRTGPRANPPMIPAPRRRVSRF